MEITRISSEYGNQVWDYNIGLYAMYISPTFQPPGKIGLEVEFKYFPINKHVYEVKSERNF